MISGARQHCWNNWVARSLSRRWINCSCGSPKEATETLANCRIRLSERPTSLLSLSASALLIIFSIRIGTCNGSGSNIRSFSSRSFSSIGFGFIQVCKKQSPGHFSYLCSLASPITSYHIFNNASHIQYIPLWPTSSNNMTLLYKDKIHIFHQNDISPYSICHLPIFHLQRCSSLLSLKLPTL